jgi:hypothetical protein
MTTLTPNGISTTGKLTKPAPVTPPVPTKKSKSRQQIIDVDETTPKKPKRRESQSTELPKMNGSAKDPPKTNTELFPSLSTPSDIAVIANESEEDSKMPATTDTIAAPPILPPTTSNTDTNIPADPSIAILPPTSTSPPATSTSPPAKKKKLLPTFSLAVIPAVQPRRIVLKGTPIIRAIVVGDSSTKTTVVFRTEKADKGSCWCDRRLELQNMEENGWCRELGMEPNWARKNGTDYNTLEYHIDGEKVRVEGNYTTRMFTVIIPGPKNMQSIINKAEIICDTLTTKFKTDSKLIGLDPDNLIWSTEPITWSELIGPVQAYNLLLHNTMIVPPAAPTQGFFEQHQNIIFDYFENGTFNQQIQQLLFAPDSVLHEDLLPATPSDPPVPPVPVESP